MSRDEARALAQQFANHLRHLREFRGSSYVGAGPLPVRGASDASAVTWPSGQVEAAPPPTEIAAPRSARSDLSADAARDPAAGPRPAAAEPARRTLPEKQAEAAPAPTNRGAPRVAEPVRLPLASPAAEAPAAEAGVRSQASTWSAAEKLEYLRRKNIGNCQRCKLAGTRTNIVFGVGAPEADLMFIGEAPGFDEDRSGEPFVGAAGRRLTQWLGKLGLGREQVYIANVLKCRPPGNRDPEADEVERCSPFLRAQIRAIAPKVIVALGRYAGILLLGKPPDTTLREMRSRSWTYADPSGAHQAALYVTYHPSYVIRRERELPPGQRNPADDTVLGDLQQALQQLRR